MRKLILLLLVLSIAAMGFAGGGADRGDSVTLRLGHVLDTNNSWHMASEHFATLVHDRSNGEITVQLFPNSSLGNDRDLVEGMQMGTVDFALVAGVLGNFYGALQLLELPYLFNNQRHLQNVIYGEVGDLMKREMRQQASVVGLEFWERAPRHLTTNFPVNTPADLNGLRIRVPEIPPMVSAWRAMGANPTPMAWGEVYTALQQGTIDAQENPLMNIVSANIQEVNSHINLTYHVYGYVIHLMSAAAFDRLSSGHRDIIVRAAAETRDFQNRMVEEEEVTLRRQLEAGGTVFVTPNIEPFQRLARTVHGEFAARYGQQLYDRIIAAGR